MKNIIIIFLSIISICNAQDISKNEVFIKSRQGKLFLSLGSEYRIAAYYNSNENQYQDRGNTNIDKQLSGPAINYNLNYFITNNLSLGFSHSFKNSLLGYDQEISNNNSSQKSINSLFMDYHFYLDYYVPISNKSQIILRLGKTVLNSGSDYSYRTNFYDETDKFLGYSISQSSYVYSPYNYAVGYKNNRFDILLGIYSSKDTPYFRDANKVTVSYIKLNYNLFKL